MALTPDARAALEVEHAEHLGNVGVEAARLARRDGLSIVDAEHVEQAARRLGTASGGGVFATVGNSIGGVLLGAGVQSVYQIQFAPGPHTASESVVAAGFSLLGGVLVTLGMSLSLKRRR